MTQPTEAVGSEQPVEAPVETAEDIYARLGEETFGVTDEEEEPVGEEGPEPEQEAADDETAAEEEADDLPPIEAPVSWDAEAKELFKNLPRDAQEIVAKREGERERFVQQKSQEAAQARQTAAQQAQAELAQLNAAYAQHYQEIASQFEVAEPDPMLQVTDPVAYAQQLRAVQQANAQRSKAQQAAQQHFQQAQALAAQAEQANYAEQHRIIVDSFPEYADPTTGPELQRKLTAVAKRIGYTDELIGQARAQDILAMRTVAEAIDKADKYDALQKTKMANVRAAKGKPPVSTRPGVSQGPEQLRARTAQAALDTALTSKNRDVSGAAFYQYLEKTGQIK